jgi:hypothetical protein
MYFKIQNRLEIGMEQNKRTLLRWPQSVLGPPPGLKELNVLCWGLFVIGFMVPLCVVLVIRWKVGARFSDLLPVDFIYFYGIGQILNQHPAINLYDYSLQLKTFNDIFPLSADHQVWGRSPYPPFVAKFFSIFARFSFERAFFAWMGMSFVLYMIAITAIVKAALPKDKLRSSLVFCFSIASPLFLYFNLAVGQLATVAVFSTSLAIFLERRSRPFLGGLALALLTYKPTLLLLILPMTLVTRRFRMLTGFCTGAAALLAASTLFAGPRIWPVYIRFLQTFAGTAGIHGASSVKRWEYVDINAVSYSIPGARTSLGSVTVTCLLAGIGLWLVILWRRSTGTNAAAQNMVWAITLTWTLLINVYVPVYDTLLIAVAATLAIGSLVQLGLFRIAGWSAVLAILISAVSFKAETVAQHDGVQPLTLLILIFGLLQAFTLQRLFQKIQKISSDPKSALDTTREQPAMNY